MYIYIHIMMGRHSAVRLLQLTDSSNIYVIWVYSLLSSDRVIISTHTQCFRSIPNGIRFIASPEDLCTVRTRDVNLLLFIQMTCTGGCTGVGVNFPFFCSISLSITSFTLIFISLREKNPLVSTAIYHNRKASYQG